MDTTAGTRERVRALLLELGPSTAAALADRLALTPAAVRRHLDALLAEGTVTTRAPRGPVVRGQSRGRGRPARLYALTDAGHAAGPSQYEDVAVGALRFLADAAGPDAVEAFAQQRATQQEDRYRARLDGAADPTAALAAALTEDGYAATTTERGAGTQICQHHCPVQAVAAEFPQLCEAETAALSRVLGVHVQRLATIAHGDGVCTTHVPRTTPTSGRHTA